MYAKGPEEDISCNYLSQRRLHVSIVECNRIGGAFHGYDSQLKIPLVQRVFLHRYKVIKNLISD